MAIFFMLAGFASFGLGICYFVLHAAAAANADQQIVLGISLLIGLTGLAIAALGALLNAVDRRAVSADAGNEPAAPGPVYRPRY